MARVYRTCRVLVPERLRERKYRQTDSDGSDGDRLPSDIAACHFAKDLEIYSEVEYNEKLFFRLIA